MATRFLTAALLALAAAPSCKSKSESPPAADNTAKNQRDTETTPTADNAGKSGTEADLTQKIRKAVLDDSSLSTTAHNCKIVVNGETVTLVGPVASEDERRKVEQIASAASGDRKIINQLEIAN